MLFTNFIPLNEKCTFWNGICKIYNKWANMASTKVMSWHTHIIVKNSNKSYSSIGWKLSWYNVDYNTCNCNSLHFTFDIIPLSFSSCEETLLMWLCYFLWSCPFFFLCSRTHCFCKCNINHHTPYSYRDTQYRMM